MIIPYNKKQREIIDLKFHTYVYTMLIDLGYDMSLLGMKYFYEMVMIASSLVTGLTSNSDVKYKDITLKNLEETLANDFNIKPNEIKTNLDYAFNTIDLTIAKKNFGPVFEQKYTNYFNPKLLQANELLHYIVDTISFRYKIQTSKFSPLTYDWTEDSIELNNQQYLNDLREYLEEYKKLSNKKNTKND